MNLTSQELCLTASTSDADSLEVKYLSCFENATLLVSEAVIAAAAAASQVSGHETADTLLADFAQKCSAGLEVKYLSCFENATLLVSDLDSVADEAVIAAAAAAAAQESGHVTADTLLDDFAQQCSYGLEVKCLSWFENAILLGVDLHSVADEAVIAAAAAAAAAQVSGHVWAHTLLAGFA